MTPWTVALQASLSSTISQSLLTFVSIYSVMLSNHLILCLYFSFCLQSLPASGSFPMSQLVTSGGQSIRASAPAPLFQWIFRIHFLSVQSLLCVWLFVTPWTAACQALLSITNSWSLLNVHWAGDAIQPSPPAFNLSQHEGLFQWVGSSHQVAQVLKLQLQHQSFQWILRVDFL